LTRRGAKVTVLDRGRSGAESTWAGGGILSPLLPWQYGSAVNALSEYSRALFPEWCARHEALSGLDAEYRALAACWCNPRLIQLRLRPGAPTTVGVANCGAATISCPRPEVGQALWLPDVAQVRNPRLVQVLRAAAEVVGVNVIEAAEVTGLECRIGQGEPGANHTRQLLRCGLCHRCRCLERQCPRPGSADHACVSGAWPDAAVQVATRGVALHRAQARCAYLIPRQDGHVLAGSTLEWCGFDKSTTELAKRELLEFAASILPDLSELVLARHWSGLRPGSPDNIPVIGAFPGFLEFVCQQWPLSLWRDHVTWFRNAIGGRH
jgi:glycine oxidase